MLASVWGLNFLGVLGGLILGVASRLVFGLSRFSSFFFPRCARLTGFSSPCDFDSSRFSADDFSVEAWPLVFLGGVVSDTPGFSLLCDTYCRVITQKEATTGKAESWRKLCQGIIFVTNIN